MALEECGGCGAYHSPGFEGDCRDDSERFTTPSIEVCWTCAHKYELWLMRTVTRYMAYLSDDGSRLTDWPGATLATVISTRTARYRGFGGMPFTRVYFSAVDVHGQRWHGTSPGRGMYARMRKVKT